MEINSSFGSRWIFKAANPSLVASKGCTLLSSTVSQTFGFAISTVIKIRYPSKREPRVGGRKRKLICKTCCWWETQ
ncbi:unnamed protein product [Caretta caretta]